LLPSVVPARVAYGACVAHAMPKLLARSTGDRRKLNDPEPFGSDD
jgi:hypothetical protein